MGFCYLNLSLQKFLFVCLILNIETSTKNCSVSLSKDGELLSLKEYSGEGYIHGENLHLFIEEVMRKAAYSSNDLSAVAVSKGPGSYTGLRIGVSAAKGLCFSLDIPLISIATLKVLAAAYKIEQSAFIAPMIDARRMEVYNAIFDSNYSQISETKAEVIDKNSFAEILEENKIYFLGDAVEKCENIITHPNAIFLEGYLPSAKEMVKLSYEKYKKNDIENVAYFEPFYLKDFILK